MEVPAAMIGPGGGSGWIMEPLLGNLMMVAALSAQGAAPAPGGATETVQVAQVKVVETVNHWSTYVSGEGSERICWASSRPVKWVASRKGVRRGGIWLAVSDRPGKNVGNEVNFRAGYPLAEGKPVSLSVGDRKFDMVSRGEDAWSASAAEDGEIVQAFRKGASATIRGVSTRGTKTTDTFSLIGFTATLQQVKESCAR